MAGVHPGEDGEFDLCKAREISEMMIRTGRLVSYLDWAGIAELPVREREETKKVEVFDPVAAFEASI